MPHSSQIMPFLMTLLVQGIFLNFVLKLERIKCLCSEDIRRDIIKYYSMFLIAMAIIVLFVSKETPVLKKYILPLMGFLNIIYLVVVVSYVHNLVKKKCECSGTWGRDVMYAYSLLLISIFLLVLMGIIGSYIIVKV